MNQEQFIARHQANWERLEALLAAGRGKPAQPDAATTDPGEFPRLYREACHHLALARARLYSQPLIERLDDLVLRGHQRLYQSRSGLAGRMLRFAAADFPATVRREWRALLLACLLFYGPFFGMLVTVQFAPEFVYTVLDGWTVVNMESMYDPENHERLGREREADSDVLMFGYYIRNNTSIGFQTFAGGLVFGLGTLFYLIYNGLVIGAVAGHLTHIGYIETFWGFVAGHSAMELTAIVISGAAGLKLAAGLVRPGRKSRLRALLDNGRVAVTLVFGAAAMFFIAAFIEAFWSSIAATPVTIKWGVGIVLWVLLIAYFLFLGRRRAA
ncbi:MAG: stage II sporulation protein M [Gammaproteobacteria bacterium]|nr:stage II sporulation protein M [Gammaproteobacteria bacterium]